MKKYEFVVSMYNGLIGHYRTVPAFMSDGIRVFYKRPTAPGDNEEIGFMGQIFKDEAEAEARIIKQLNLWLETKYITQYTVTKI